MTDAAFILLARAVGDPTRLRVLLQLGNHPLTVGQLADGAGISASAATYHVAKMHEAGLVGVERKGRQTFVRRVERRWAAIVIAFGRME